MNLYDALTEILTDPSRSSLYSGSQLVALLRDRGVQLPVDRGEAFELVADVRYKIESNLYRARALKSAISTMLRENKQLSQDNLLLLLVATGEDLPADQASAVLLLPNDYNEALALIVQLCDELERKTSV